MPAGRLRDRITLLARQSGRDAVGQPLDDWGESPPIWADVQMIGGREQIRAGREVSEGQYSIRIRHRPGVTTAQRIRLAVSGEVLDIKLAQPDQRRAWLTITAERVDP
jgi:SPP1 family predicted phage head-tail adaptor